MQINNSEEFRPEPTPHDRSEPEINRPLTPLNKIISRESQEPVFIESLLHFNNNSKKRSGIKLALLNWTSALIDSLVLISISCFVMIMLSLLMKTSAGQVIRFVMADSSVMSTFIVSFAMSYWSYLVLSRLWMGASLGEWACDLRLGQPVERIRSDYALRVMLRTTCVFMTGLVLLPLFSAIFRRDLAGEISGIKVYSLV
jgi:uncharacterized RDD family membrane protein YckC